MPMSTVMVTVVEQTLARITGPAVGIKDEANFAETVVAADFVPTLILTKSVFVITFVVVSAAETVSDADSGWLIKT